MDLKKLSILALVAATSFALVGCGGSSSGSSVSITDGGALPPDNDELIDEEGALVEPENDPKILNSSITIKHKPYINLRADDITDPRNGNVVPYIVYEGSLMAYRENLTVANGELGEWKFIKEGESIKTKTIGEIDSLEIFHVCKSKANTEIKSLRDMYEYYTNGGLSHADAIDYLSVNNTMDTHDVRATLVHLEREALVNGAVLDSGLDLQCGKGNINDGSGQYSLKLTNDAYFRSAGYEVHQYMDVPYQLSIDNVDTNSNGKTAINATGFVYLQKAGVTDKIIVATVRGIEFSFGEGETVEIDLSDYLKDGNVVITEMDMPNPNQGETNPIDPVEFTEKEIALSTIKLVNGLGAGINNQVAKAVENGGTKAIAEGFDTKKALAKLTLAVSSDNGSGDTECSDSSENKVTHYRYVGIEWFGSHKKIDELNEFQIPFIEDLVYPAQNAGVYGDGTNFYQFDYTPVCSGQTSYDFADSKFMDLTVNK